MSIEGTYNVLFLDIECTVQRTEHGIDNSPFNPKNYLVSIGAGFDKENINYICVNHNHKEKSEDNLQELLDRASMVVAHNAKFDLLWLSECGYKIDCPVYCTMIAEYVLSRGQKRSISLANTAKRYNVTLKKSELMENTFKKGIGYEEMDWDIVEEYGRGDVISCMEVFYAQAKYIHDHHIYLLPTMRMMNEMLVCLVDMERSGISINTDTLADVKQRFLEEDQNLQEKMHLIIGKCMGDADINLNSPAQLSEVIYSRRIKSRDTWKEIFNLGLDERGRPLPRPSMKTSQFVSLVRLNTDVIRMSTKDRCGVCKGKGSIQKFKKDGSSYKNRTKCKNCNGHGIVYNESGKVAGLMLSPTDVMSASANGFATDKVTINSLIKQAKKKDNTLAQEFLESLQRHNALSTYLSTFCEGLARHTRCNGVLHTNFNQCVTSTGRLSSSNPNFQNLPRSGTFPIRECIVSRFDGGKIIEADFAGLEFRVAADLSRDKQMLIDIESGKDVHSQTASIIYQIDPNEVSKNQRQTAKAFTFAPLYGGMGMKEEPHIQKYFKEYFNIYRGLKRWHDKLKSNVIANNTVRLPSGREFYWENVRRFGNGGVSYSTQICNFPVQSFATGDIVPLSVIRLYKSFKDKSLKSQIIITVHDSIVVDAHAEEVDIVLELLEDAMVNVGNEVESRYQYQMEVDLSIEIKVGTNWMNGEVHHG